MKIVIEVSNAAGAHGPPLDAVLMALRRGAWMVAQTVKAHWIQMAQAENVRRTGAYIRGLQDSSSVRVVKEPPTQSSNRLPPTWEMVIDVVNTAEHAQLVEEGHGGFHLPTSINWANNRGRIKGTGSKRYLHIPFRHTAFASPEQRIRGGYTPGAIQAMMPQHIHQEAKRLAYRMKARVGPIYEGGRFIAADKYEWSGQKPPPKSRRQLNRASIPPMIQLGEGRAGGGSEYHQHNVGFEERRGQRGQNPAWQFSKYHGLFKAGTKGHAQYMTIRTLTPDSQGWHIPALRGHHLASKVGIVVGASQTELNDVALGPLRALLTIGDPA